MKTGSTFRLKFLIAFHAVLSAAPTHPAAASSGIAGSLRFLFGWPEQIWTGGSFAFPTQSTGSQVISLAPPAPRARPQTAGIQQNPASFRSQNGTFPLLILSASQVSGMGGPTRS